MSQFSHILYVFSDQISVLVLTVVCYAVSLFANIQNLQQELTTQWFGNVFVASQAASTLGAKFLLTVKGGLIVYTLHTSRKQDLKL